MEKVKKRTLVQSSIIVLLVLVLGISVLLLVPLTSRVQDTAENGGNPTRQHQSRRRAQSASRRDNLVAQDTNCGISGPPKEILVNATWTASYPGSGAKLTWKLIQAVTGIATGDDYFKRNLVGMGVVAAVKTHYPSHTPEHIFAASEFANIDRAILLLRNPLTSIPSYHNFEYEQNNKLRDHSTRAPIEDWIKWRNQFFGKELQAWVDHAEWWVEHYAPHNALHIVPFEKLTGQFGEHTGIDTLKSMSGFLAAGDQRIADNMVQSEKMDCIWYQYVKLSSVPGQVEVMKSHRVGGPTEYPFTSEHLEQMAEVLTRLWSRHMPDRKSSLSMQLFCDLLLEYIIVIKKKKSHIQLMG